jgi:predicted nucleotidyltransferase
MEEQQVLDCTIYRAVHGSRAYGTQMAHSDRDEKGVCIPRDPNYYYGYKKFEQKDSGWADGVDRCIFDLRKFFNLALKCNPNIIEMLYVEEEDILQINELGQELRDNRDIFLSREAANNFVGYATSQLHRIKGHKKWIDDPPSQPVETDFWKNTVLGSEAATFRIELEGHTFEVDPKVVGYAGSVVEIRHFDGVGWKAANKKYKQYLNWKRDRNPARAELEAKFSMDTKHAGHLVRLLRMGKEILAEGKVRVRRPDAQELLDIRNGKFKYEELVEYAEQLREEVNSMVSKSPLPVKPDSKKAEALLLSLIQRGLNDNKA